MSTINNAIHVENLTYHYPNGTTGLEKISFSLPWGSRLVLIGPNGAGKSTLLKLLSGQRKSPKDSIVLLDGKNPFNDFSNNITTYLGTDWILNNVIRRDMPVETLIDTIGINKFPERRDDLIEILDIDLSWNMNRISDGQRRRIQLLLKLFTNWEILLLDEVTVDLDVLVRLRLLNWLKNETIVRKCCIIYATHIFDGIATLNFPSHLVHINNGIFLKTINFNEQIEFLNDNVNGDLKFGDIEKLLMGDIKHDGIDDDDNEHSNQKIKISKVESIHPLALRWLSDDYKNSK